MLTRRGLLVAGSALLAGASTLLRERRAHAQVEGATGVGRVPLVTPNGVSLPSRRVDGARVFHLVAEECEHEMTEGLTIDAWGYNGRTPGPTIEAIEGELVRIYVTNRLPEPTSLHCHGLILPNGMDGVSGLNQRPILTGETFRYEFVVKHAGTFRYHPHFDEMTQMALGMMGMFIVHPRRPEPVDRDFAIMLSEWSIEPGTRRPDPGAMSDFNMLTMNSRAFPGTAPLVVKVGDRVRIRFGNLSAMDSHPIHLHGYAFKVTATDGGPTPPSAQHLETTVLVPVGATRVIEFVADAPGDWAMHCHMTHHIMNQMGHGLPNTLGVDAEKLDKRMRRLLPDYMTMGQKGMGGMGEMGMEVPKNSVPMKGGAGPFGMIDMGGMFTILKVRESLTEGEDPGWYRNPEGTVARVATSSELASDGIDPKARVKR